MPKGYPKNPKTIEERFWDKVQVGLPDDCWLWTGSTTPNARGSHYGRFNHKYVVYRAHVFSYELATGNKVEKGKVVMHSCDNTLCVNPNHLSKGMNRDNIDDMLMKGRSLYGEKHPGVVLSEEQVREIRQLKTTGIRVTQLTKRFGVKEATIYAVCSRRLWKHVQ
jgi:hypothetical protein